MDQALIDDLSRPAAYPGRPRSVEQRETHISRLFFTDSHVYKLKKSVDFGFLDFTTLERRRHFCEEEVRLNRRLAPDMYLGVVPITLGTDGKHRVGVAPGRADAVLAVGAEPVEWAVEWAVAMRRLPERCMLDVLLTEGAIDNAHLDELARTLVDFHAASRADSEVAAHGSPASVSHNIEENFDQTRPFTGPPHAILSNELHGFLAGRAQTWLTAAHDLLERRARDGRVREGHGDLHSGNICFDGDEIVIYDCIEFSDRLRCGDVACDLAFLAMDLDLAGFSAFGRYLVKRYAELADDGGLVELITPYKEYRAIVRAKIACFAAAAPETPAEVATAKRLEALRYFHLAAEYALPPALVLMSGLPASGKSWFAKRIARALDAALYASDVRRRSISGAQDRLSPAEYGGGAYAPRQRARVYDSLLASAREALSSGRSVVVDATFGRRAQRAPFLALADELGHACVLVHARADEATVRTRMLARGLDPRALSHADMTVYERARADFEVPDEVPALVEAWPDQPIEVLVGGLVEARLP